MLPQDAVPNTEDQSAKMLLNDNWGINPSKLIPIPMGNALCWRLVTSDNEELFFKQMREEVVPSEVRAGEIVEVQNYFASQGLPVVKPQATKNGSFYIHSNGAYFIVYPFVKSELKASRDDLTQANLDSMAEVLAKMHIAGAKKEAPKVGKVFKGWKSPDSFNETIAKLRQFLEQKSAAPSGLDDRDLLVLRALDAKSRIINQNTVAYEDLGLKSDHLTHGDYQERNVFFGGDGNVEWLIDFDACEMAPRSREIARAIDLLCIDRKDLSEAGLAKAKRFFQKYNAINPISADEVYKGWFTSLMKTGMSLFGYTEYYFNGDQRAIRLIDDEDAEKLEEYFARLREVVEIVTQV